ncbi:MAG: N-acetylmuramoyl-L-alanine amidase family protein [Candidatus Atribacteria bacterium]|nr:N-acetylmuramoyl-L-alanine amidase family protein [Candidatus Atribacteria bacterium]
MKKILRIILITALFAILFTPFPTLAQSSEIKILLDNKSLETVVPSVIENDRLFISARNVVETLGGRITWFPALKLMTININNRTARLVIDDPSLEIDEQVIPLEIPARIIDNRVMIPLEVIKIIAEVDIKWDNQAKTLFINTIRPYLLEVRSYSHPDKTRVVIDLSEKTEFRADKLINPDRIFIDIMGSVAKLEDTSKQIKIDDGVIKTVRTAQFNEEITRVVFDLYQEARYELFSLIEPDRVVIDIFKSGEEAAITEILPAKSEEKPTPGPEIIGKRAVIIDPGHGGKDPGAIGPTGLKESEVTLGIALYLEKLLKGAGIPTYLTRSKDEFVYLEDRTNFANQKNGFLFVSLHANSVLNHRPSAEGIETFLLSSKYIGASARDVADRENRASRAHPEVDTDLALIIADLEESANIKYSFDIADIIQKKLVEYLKLENRGIKQAPFVVLKGANMAAVIVEVAFISNPKEEELLKTNKFRENTAQALFEAIKYYIENAPNNGE